ncbi:MAG: 16S rRNA (guanine(527)-N(7))-methyltransferase RsmG [candidate division WOR-3 bacterium]
MTDWGLFVKNVSELGCRLTGEQLTNFQKYYQLILNWNQKINLISRQDTHRLLSYHFIDSLIVLNDIPKDSAVCDVGSGAGLPGIPLKIIRDDITVYLIESIQKKAAFLRKVVDELDLKRTKVIAQRVELEIKNPNSEVVNNCDIVLIRLLGKIRKVAPIVTPLLAPQGKIIFYKSTNAIEEISSAQKILESLSLKAEIKKIALPNTAIVRHLVYLNKNDWP